MGILMMDSRDGLMTVLTVSRIIKKIKKKENYVQRRDYRMLQKDAEQTKDSFVSFTNFA